MWRFGQKASGQLTAATRVQRFRELAKQLVPPSGDADTRQGEVLRLIGNAEDEANRNGFVNWDDEDDREIDLFVSQMIGGKLFDDLTNRRIQTTAEKIKQAGHDTQQPSPTEADWNFMFGCAVDWCEAHPEPIPIRDEGDYIGHF